MESGIEAEQIMQELKSIRTELHTIKENMPDKEMFLTAEENRLLSESYLNEKNGAIISSKELRRELGI